MEYNTGVTHYFSGLRFFALLAAAVAIPCLAADPTDRPDNSWVSVSGTVVSAKPDSFQLNYGDGTILVEMDDWDWYAEGAALKSGDKVTVSGRMDDELYEKKSIEAESVYLQGLNTYFYASATDEEDWNFPALSGAEPASTFILTGTISAVQGREFRLDTGERRFIVDTRNLLYNPLDGLGHQKLAEGDRVRVAGKVSVNLFDKGEILAESITTLVRDKTKRKQ